MQPGQDKYNHCSRDVLLLSLTQFFGYDNMTSIFCHLKKKKKNNGKVALTNFISSYNDKRNIYMYIYILEDNLKKMFHSLLEINCKN